MPQPNVECCQDPLGRDLCDNATLGEGLNEISCQAMEAVQLVE